MFWLTFEKNETENEPLENETETLSESVTNVHSVFLPSSGCSRAGTCVAVAPCIVTTAGCGTSRRISQRYGDRCVREKSKTHRLPWQLFPNIARQFLLS